MSFFHTNNSCNVKITMPKASDGNHSSHMNYTFVPEEQKLVPYCIYYWMAKVSWKDFQRPTFFAYVFLYLIFVIKRLAMQELSGKSAGCCWAISPLRSRFVSSQVHGGFIDHLMASVDKLCLILSGQQPVESDIAYMWEVSSLHCIILRGINHYNYCFPSPVLL